MAKKGRHQEKNYCIELWGGANFFQISEKGAILLMSLGNPGLKDTKTVYLNVKQATWFYICFKFITVFRSKTMHLIIP